MTPPRNDGARVRMPADVDTPDKVVYGLTFRQLAILAAAAVAGYTAWRGLRDIVPAAALLAGGVLVAGVAFAVAVGRRDGQPLDAWLIHAIRFAAAPKALTTLDAAGDTPRWVEQPRTRAPLPAPLRLPVEAIDDDGPINLGNATAAVVATTTVNLGLRTTVEQSALIEHFGRWLNSLSAPTQIVVSAQPVDLTAHARDLARASAALTHPALREACVAHAAFLEQLAARRDPLRRQVLITTSAPADRGSAAVRRAEDTVRAFAGLGVTSHVLDGPAVTAAIAAAADPYSPSHAVRRATGTVTGPTTTDHTTDRGAS